MTPAEAATARAQLAAVAADRSWAPDLGRPRQTPDARPAAVLMLFGVLDSMPAATDLSPVATDLDVLLLARAPGLRAHPGQIAFPGGRADPGDDNPAATALREAEEETGLDPTGVDVLGALGQLPLPVSNHMVTPVLGWWARPTPVRVVDHGESAHVFRVPIADLLNPANRGTVVVRRDGASFRSPGFTVRADDGEHIVWGFTAFVLDALFERLSWTMPWDRERRIELL